jgi:hypothetical protein
MARIAESRRTITQQLARNETWHNHPAHDGSGCFIVAATITSVKRRRLDRTELTDVEDGRRHPRRWGLCVN